MTKQSDPSTFETAVVNLILSLRFSPLATIVIEFENIAHHRPKPYKSFVLRTALSILAQINPDASIWLFAVG